MRNRHRRASPLAARRLPGHGLDAWAEVQARPYSTSSSYARVAARARQWLASRRRADATIAVTHEMISRTIQGAYAALTVDETLARWHRHDRIYRLHAGRVDEMSGRA